MSDCQCLMIDDLFCCVTHTTAEQEWKEGKLDHNFHNMLSSVFAVVTDTITYWACLCHFVFGGAKFTECKYFKGERRIQAHIFSLALIFRLWSEPHYRNGTYQDDMIKNLRNVAIPGTGIPLSLFCYTRVTVMIWLTVLYPILALAAAFNRSRTEPISLYDAYHEQLLQPRDWFSFWRLNCTLATYHSSLTHDVGYEMEDKLTFLQTAEKLDIAVSPILDCPGIVAKHRNEEGGLGFMAFKNALAGGDWILQETLTNDKNLQRWLPDPAPLSTFRVITASKGGLSNCGQSGKPKVAALSCVWRAGRQGAATDHSSVLFNVNRDGVFGAATTNAHWYQLGLTKVFTTNWTSHHDILKHPDTNGLIAGQRMFTQKEMDNVFEFCCDAHQRMMPGVPLSGWDVALTNKGMLLLECNLSCNFFRGTFDENSYFDFIVEYFCDLESKQK